MTTPQAASQPIRRRVRLALLAALMALALLLLADLRFRGLVWRFAWANTGEAEPIAQLRGLVELGGNLIRTPLDTRPITPIQHVESYPYGVNTFLQKEVEEPKLRVMLAMIRDAGLRWLRQEFPWEDLEVDGRGQFTDARNDLDGDGQPDTIDAWAKYDRLVSLVEEHGLRLLVRLSNPPDWAQAANAGNFAPPADLQDFVNYATAVAQRYKGRIRHYQIWNEPNIYPEWGENFADPVAYTDMLCRTYAALKAVDPQIVVVSAAIAPTISLDGFMGYQDLAYLQRMYDSGAAACFDVMAAQAYGLFSGALDRRMRLTSVTVARHLYYRDLMVANGDAHKPIWLSEAAWNPVLDAPLPRQQIADFSRFGEATLQEAADNMPLLYERARREWPWVGAIFYWFFTRPDPSEMGQSFFYFRMVEPDYQPYKPTFTALPVYHAVRNYLTTLRPRLYQGVHQAEHWAIQRRADRALTVDGAAFGQAQQVDSLRLAYGGTSVWLRYQSDEPLDVWQGEQRVAQLPASPEQWALRSVWSGGWAEGELDVQAQDGASFIVDSVIVRDDSWQAWPALLVLGVLMALGLLELAYAAWARLNAP
ncbi:MAG: endo-1,4-beta-xylanase [Anaerolineae bacterium]|nr:endo-1,4-beta-xylanase [Anaerolineae bacterium]MDW8171883.1 hypothetical protein [Anaerolineae bacterium]